MKKCKSAVIAVILIIFGIIGILFCAIPSVSAEEKVVKNYIDAIDKCDMQGIKNCFPLDETESMLGSDYGDIFNSYGNNMKTKQDYVEMCGLAAYSELPDDIKEVKKISIISINKMSVSGADSMFSLSTIPVNATVKITYIDDEGNKLSFTSTETFQVSKVLKDYKIISM